jgi:hypothetical protein
MKFTIGNHLQEIGSIYHGYVEESFTLPAELHPFSIKSGTNWYLLENDELNLVNHWVPEGKLELHKQPLRDFKLEKLGIK